MTQLDLNQVNLVPQSAIDCYTNTYSYRQKRPYLLYTNIKQTELAMIYWKMRRIITSVFKSALMLSISINPKQNQKRCNYIKLNGNSLNLTFYSTLKHSPYPSNIEICLITKSNPTEIEALIKKQNVPFIKKVNIWKKRERERKRADRYLIRSSRLFC